MWINSLVIYAVEMVRIIYNNETKTMESDIERQQLSHQHLTGTCISEGIIVWSKDSQHKVTHHMKGCTSYLYHYMTCQGVLPIYIIASHDSVYFLSISLHDMPGCTSYLYHYITCQSVLPIYIITSHDSVQILQWNWQAWFTLCSMANTCM